jgi:adenylate cyclase 9
MATASVSSSNNIANDITPAGLFAFYIEVTLLLYTVVPLPLYCTLTIGVIYSILFETLLSVAVPKRVQMPGNVVINILLHICIHIIGIHILITIQVL